ncbi:MAG TPA: MBOAT family protein [Terracidiphilus sp.]|jgi:D-alanyl-lipoteichoic acid acyltransferase DltB (MBOAT superfamily)
MLFPTVEYALFFLAVLAVAWSLYRFPTAHKSFLLLASYIFYGFWNWAYIPLLFGISLFSGLVAQRIQRSRTVLARKCWLAAGVTVCLATLGYFKYTGFLLTTLLQAWGRFAPPPHIQINSPLLPLGISFFIFHAISLLCDCYRGKVREPVNLGDALLYVAFFPQLIAGPILRASRFLPQLAIRRNPNSIRVNRAFLLIAGGLFKKVVISNMLATRLVEPVFAVPQSFGAWDTLLAVYGYAAQIYCDFSGYTDIAIGCALLLGYRFPRNFNAPYTAADPQDFWRRWHISLSSWLRDYLYFPLGGSRKGKVRTYINLMVTMLLGGLWHGAAWTFVAWGGLHGFYLVVHRLWSRIGWHPLVRWRATAAWRWASRILLFHAVCAGWVFFRASSFATAFTVFGRLTVPGVATLATGPVLIVLFLGLAGQYMPPRWRNGLEIELGRWPALARGAVLAVAIATIEILGPTGVAPFIYFQF